MATHVKAVGTLHVVFGVLGILASLAILLFYGGLATLIGFTDQSDDRFVAIPVLGVIFGIGAILVFLLSLPGLIGGIGLLLGHNWARIVLIVVSCLELLKFPFGTALGVYSLWVLLNKDAERTLTAAHP
jgi:hypothetical protein